MGDPGRDGATTEATVAGEAYAAARELLRRAEDDAAMIRADADRYLRQRQLEAELVVSKARRMLAIAEERAAAMDRGASPRPPVATPAAGTAWDLDPDPPATVDLTVAPEAPARAAPRVASELDSILAGAVSRAIDRALPAEHP